MEKIYSTGDNGLATLKSEIVAGYNTTKITKLPGFHFVYGGDNGDVFHIFFELDYGMWCISIGVSVDFKFNNLIQKQI